MSNPTAGAFRFTHWPTESRTILQRYKANPDVYREFGLRGHEGVDIAAPYESRIFAVAAGAVERVRQDDGQHAYGNAVYIRHSDGYRTAYAHLKQVHVSEGDAVNGGDLIGLADGTGNVFPRPTSIAPHLGSHLHLTLYLDGASARGETDQPHDIVDPTPFLDLLLAEAWPAPPEPLVSGWGWAPSIERRDRLGRVSFEGGINVRREAAQEAIALGLLPHGAIVHITGEQQNNYYPLRASKAALGIAVEDEPAPPGQRFDRELLNFRNHAQDYNNIQPGRQFKVTWTVRNSGDALWDGAVTLAYVEAQLPETVGHTLTPMGAAATTPLSELTGRQQIPPNETAAITLTLTAPTQAGRYAAHWQLRTASGAPIGDLLWMHIGVPAIEPAPSPLPQGHFQAGMNVNPDAHGPDVERLRGLAWVRYVYKASARQRNVDEAFQQQYRDLIQRYAAAGIKSLLVINQETEWGNGPWDHGDWPAYAAMLASAARRIAELCSRFGDNVAYQIWNEEDSPPTNPSAIGVAPEDFAPVLAQTVQAIRQAHPGATIVIGGLNSGPDNAIAYLRRIEARLGAPLPVDALAVHPYGRYVRHDPFYNRQFGTLQEALAKFRNAYPSFPLWITELGVADNNPIGPEHYEKIADYMREIVAEVAANHGDHVPVLIWFAWSDLMRNAGVTTIHGEIKPHIGDAFREMVARSQQQPDVAFAAAALAAGGATAARAGGGPAAGAPAAFAFAASAASADSEFLHFTTTLTNHNAVPAGSTFTNRWRFRNSGATTWDGGNRLVYAPAPGDAGAHPLMAQTAYALSEVAAPLPAAPNAEVTVTLAMTAPPHVGRYYRSRWELRDAQGNAFGHLYAEISTAPPSTAGSGAQHASMAFVADHTVPDDTRFVAGESFLKQWRVRNDGARKWGDGFRLVFVEGDLQMAFGAAAHMVPPAARGEEVILSVPMVAPPPRDGEPTAYQSLWRLQDDRGNYAGEPIWARIVSLAAGAAAPLGRFANPNGWYSQLDPRWLGERLGHGQQNIGGWGCLLTCYAMMLTAYGLPITPAELNRRLRQAGAAAFQGSNVQFAAPGLVLPGVQKMRHLRSWPTPEIAFTEWTGEDPIARIDNALAQGYVMLAQVDREPNNAAYYSTTEQHWVILLARTPQGDDYLVLDPNIPPHLVHTQPISLMQKYGSAAPSPSHEENLRNAIKSALAYWFEAP